MMPRLRYETLTRIPVNPDRLVNPFVPSTTGAQSFGRKELGSRMRGNDRRKVRPDRIMR
jgi:hypothetical protein